MGNEESLRGYLQEQLDYIENKRNQLLRPSYGTGGGFGVDSKKKVGHFIADTLIALGVEERVYKDILSKLEKPETGKISG